MGLVAALSLVACGRVGFDPAPAGGGGFAAARGLSPPAAPATQTCPWTKPTDNVKAYDTFTLCINPDLSISYDCEAITGAGDIESGGPISVGAWHHLAMTW